MTRPLFKRCRCGHTPMSHQDQAIHRAITCPLLRPLGASEGVPVAPMPLLVERPAPAQVRRVSVVAMPVPGGPLLSGVVAQDVGAASRHPRPKT